MGLAAIAQGRLALEGLQTAQRLVECSLLLLHDRLLELPQVCLLLLEPVQACR